MAVYILKRIYIWYDYLYTSHTNQECKYTSHIECLWVTPFLAEHQPYITTQISIWAAPVLPVLNLLTFGPKVCGPAISELGRLVKSVKGFLLESLPSGKLTNRWLEYHHF